MLLYLELHGVCTDEAASSKILKQSQINLAIHDDENIFFHIS